MPDYDKVKAYKEYGVSLQSKARDCSNCADDGSGADYYSRDGSYTRDNSKEFSYGDFGALNSCKLPSHHLDIMWEVMVAYESAGIVRNVIDLMSDFGSCGIKLEHPLPRVEQFYQNWFSRVGGPDRSERFLSNFYKYGVTILRRKMGTATLTKRRDIQKYGANSGILDTNRVNKFNIPIKYTFLNPSMIDLVGGSVTALMDGTPVLGIKLPFHITQALLKPKTPLEKKLINQIPKDFLDALKGKSSQSDIIPLDDQENISVYYYKKDDWDAWSKPIIYSILADIKLLMKHRLADFRVLDSALDAIRIIKIGDMEQGLYPDDAAFSKLKNEIKQPNDGIRTLIWGPDIQMLESTMEAYKFLGEAKYRPTLDAIHAGLGIPPTLTGASSDRSGGTNSLVSLKTLIKRLQYGRIKLREFWMGEIVRIQKAMGFSKPASISFDDMNLEDEDAEKRIWIELADRGIISDEWIQRKFGVNPDTENSRIVREDKKRIKNKKPAKTSPYHDPQVELKTKKELVNQGLLNPEELNLRLNDDSNLRDIDDIPNLAHPNTETNEGENSKEVKKNGRPPGSKDEEPRKKRTITPVLRSNKIWAKSIQEDIAKILTPQVLAKYNKKNIRSLSSKETETFQKLVFCTLFTLPEGANIDCDNVQECLASLNTSLYSSFIEEVKDTEKELNRVLTLDEKREVAAEIKCLT